MTRILMGFLGFVAGLYLGYKWGQSTGYTWGQRDGRAAGRLAGYLEAMKEEKRAHAGS